VRNSDERTTTFAPLHVVANAIPDNYIVVLKPSTPLDVLAEHTSFIHSAALRFNAGIINSNVTSPGVKSVYTTVLKGYSGHFDAQTLDLIRTAPEVEYIEHDQVVWASRVQNDAPWGLARISHRERLRLSTFKKYEFDDNGGEGVDVYVIDTGEG
jgi:cerevisin